MGQKMENMPKALKDQVLAQMGKENIAKVGNTGAWKIELPLPPSVNHYYVHLPNGMVIGKAGKAYRAVTWAAARLANRAPMDGALKVDIAVLFPNHHKRDLDNLLKCLLDAMQKAGVYGDDSQIEDLRIYKAGYTDGGKVIVRVEKIT